jgi:fluoroacetyl-CoA thioesterase
MKDSLKSGLTHRFQFRVTPSKTVPQLYHESEMFREMPEVFATGFMVGLQFSHLAATPPGLTVTVDVRLESVDGRKLTFSITAHDGVDKITEGTHERVVIDHARFAARMAEKSRSASGE